MKLHTVYTDTFQQIGWDEQHSIQIMKWLPGTAEICYAQFKGCVLINAGFSEQLGARNVLVDSREFCGEGIPMNDMWEWRSRESAPHYNSAGVQKFAFLFSEGATLPPSSGEHQKNETFPTHYFNRLDDALAHFGANNLAANL